MKILYLSHSTAKNGSTIALLNIIRGMRSKKVEIGIVLPKRSGFLYEEVLGLGCDIFDLDINYPYVLTKPKSSNALKLLKSWFCIIFLEIKCQYRFWKVVKTYVPDIVHCNNSTIDYGLFGCYVTNTPHVWHIREYQDLDFHFDIFPSKKILEWKMKRKFNFNIAITKGVFNHFNLRSQDIVIYDGVIDANIESVNKEHFDFPYFIYVGTICEGKGLLSALNSFVKVHGEYSDIHFVVVGSFNRNEPYVARCLELVNGSRIEKNVHFVGFRDDVYSLMQNAISLIVPSYFEGFGFITVEAMHNKCLVIGRNTAGTKEQFDRGMEAKGGEIALRFNKDEELVQMMKNALVANYDDMKLRAKEMVDCHYSNALCVGNIYVYYEKVLCKQNKV